jgi:tripartite-type tricarboxylate transporter receptor subunit TctC
MRFGVRFWAAALGLALSFSSAVAADSARPFYAGKQITFTVGQPPAGGADVYARLVQRHLPRHIPGTPAILVQNMPGAGSLNSIIWLSSTAPADGTAMATFNSELLDEALTARNRVHVDFRGFNWIGNVSEDLRVCFVWAASGVSNWQALRTLARPLFWGATAAGTAGNADYAMLQQLFAIPLKPVLGYAGAADKRLAVERREIDGDCGGWTTIPADWLRDHKINIVVRLSPTLVPGIDAGIPFAGDLVKNERERKLYDFLVAPERLGRLLVMSGKVPADRVAILRTAFDAMIADPAFRAEAARLNLLVTPMTGQEVARRIAELYATPPDIIAQAKKILGE